MRLLALAILAVPAALAAACSSFDAVPAPDSTADGGGADGPATSADGGATDDGGGRADGSLPPVVAVAQENGAAQWVATDAQYIYWWSVDHASIMRADKDQPSAVTVLVARASQTVSAVAVDGTGVYWLESGPDVIDGGTTDRIMALAPGAPTPTALFATSDSLKFLALGSYVLSTYKDGIVRAKAGTTADTLAVGIDRSALASDGTDAIYTYGNSGVWRLTPANASSRIINLPNPHQLVVESATMYGLYDSAGGSSLFKTDKAGMNKDQSAATELTQIAGGPIFVAIDTLGVVFGNGGDGTIKRVSRNGGDPALVISGRGGLNAVAADARGVYWTTDTGEVGWAPR